MVEVAARDHPTVSARLDEFLRLMADPTRRRIFLQLMAGETCNCELVGLLGLTQNLISHHLRQLREYGLIHARRDPTDKRWVYYSVDREALAAAYGDLLTLFDPGRVSPRASVCGPSSTRCSP
ncbi:MAG: winged helix-turn-helix transcriptional regulator [Chloroflexi bacterium]|nr:winged helix-turn-helix transcriptional regulator [Chloroflexota bacterium]